MATRFRFNRNARATAMMVWSPRNGENPKKTPSAKAAAVRSGVSLMCSSALSQRRMSERVR
jgi:hypothetical protein